MELGKKSCRLCLTETDFNVSLFGSYCRKTNMLDKILVCLRLPIEENENLDTICHKCADNVERYYEFITYIKKAQAKVGSSQRYIEPRHVNTKHENETHNVHMNKRLVTSYVREQVFDTDYTFSFLDAPNEEKKETRPSSPLFSYLSPPNVLKDSFKDSLKETVWKTPQQKTKYGSQRSPKRSERIRAGNRASDRPRHHSRDLFESQSQDVEEHEPRSFDWKLTPEDNIIKRVRENCFGLSNF